MALRKIAGQEYTHWLAELKETIRNRQLKAALKVNSEMLSLYWDLGKAITEKQVQASWGDKIVTQLSADLISEFPEIKGFSITNIKYIRKWYQFYTSSFGQQTVDQMPKKLFTANISIGQQAVDLLQVTENEFPTILGIIPWGHHIQILTKTSSIEEALFYITQTATYNWSRAVLMYHLESGLFQQKGNAYNNFDVTLPQPQSELAKELIKNQYNLDFLGLGEEATERDLENAILGNIKKFMLALGSGFSFLGQQYHLKVGEKDYYLDLLFYHARLHCYFVIELKVVEFKPEHAGKLEFYITAIDDLIKLPEDNPTIGLLLCKTVDKVIVEYTLRNKTKAMGISEYRHSLPDELKSQLPDEEVLKLELQKGITTDIKPVDEKLNKLRGLIQKLNPGKVALEKNADIVEKVIKEIGYPLIKLIDLRLSEIKKEFNSTKIEIVYNTQRGGIYDSHFDISSIGEFENIWMFGFEFVFNGFAKGGKKAFDAWHKLEIQLEKYKFSIGPERGKVWDDRTYNELLSKEELDVITDRFVEMMLDDINTRIEGILT
jgi:predicted nuclease of restriction endonuclease-like (RecB) superfamily